MSQKRLKQLRRKESVVTTEVNKLFLPNFWEIVKSGWKYLLVVSILAVVLYANGMWGGFVSDDYATITQNPRIGDFWYNMTTSGIANSMNMSNYFVYKIFGNSNPVPYHLVSLLWFLLFNILAFVFIKLITKNDWVAKLSVMIFVFHPIHVEAVSWIAGRIYLILAVYILASVINFIYFIDTGKIRSLLWSGLFFVLAFGTDRPRPFGIFLIIVLYLFLVGWRSFLSKYLKYIWVFVAVGLIALIISWPYISDRIGVVNSGVNTSGSIFYNPLFQYPTALSKYLQLLFLPVDLTLYHTMYVFPWWLNWMILVNYLALVIYFYFKDKRYFWALSFVFVSIAPSISPIKVSWLVAERYIFLGSLGFCLFWGLLMNDHWKKFKTWTPVLLMLLLIYYGAGIYFRNIDWRTNHNLWVNTCQVSPNSHNAWNNIGDDYDKLKDYDNAVKGFTQSVLVKPNYADAYHNRANIFFKAGRFDLARESYETALRFSPNLYQTYLSLTQIDLMEKKGDLALAHASKAVEIKPDDLQSYYVLGIVKAQTGSLDEAKNIFEKILQRFPDYELASSALKEINRVMSSQNK
jgi:tetratricopeptide (TPR) repeat protein